MRRIPKVRFQARAMGIALFAILLGRKIICLGRPPLKPETPPSLPPFPVSKATRNAGIAVVPLNHHGKVVTENLTRQSWPPVIVSLSSFSFSLLHRLRNGRETVVTALISPGIITGENPARFNPFRRNKRRDSRSTAKSEQENIDRRIPFAEDDTT